MVRRKHFVVEKKIQLVCAGCLSVNRVPCTRLGDHPICGKCKQSLVPNHPLELTDDNFQRFISKTELRVVVDFWASWCPPCRAMSPAFQAAAEKLAPDFLLAKLSTEVSPVVSQSLNIQGIPCLIGFQNGREVARQSGAMQTDQIVAWVRAQNWNQPGGE